MKPFVHIDPNTFRAARLAAGYTREDINRLSGKWHTAKRIEELGKPVTEDAYEILVALLDLPDPLDPMPPRDMWEHAGEFIARIRAARGWTQIELGQHAGYAGDDVVRRVESGRDLARSHLAALRTALDLPVDFWTGPLPPAVEPLSVIAGRSGAGNSTRHQVVDIPGDLVSAARVARSLTRIEFAALADLSHKTLARIERTSQGSEEAFLKLRDLVDLPDVPLSPAAEERVNIGRYVRAERHRRLMTVEQLGYRAGLSWFTIKNVEHGLTVTPAVLKALRRVIDLPEQFGHHEPVPSHRPLPSVRVPRIVPTVELDSAVLAKTWFDNPPCQDAPAGLFDPIGDDEIAAAAWVRLNAAHRDYCGTCPYARECRQAAVTHCIEGIWGSGLFQIVERAWNGRGRDAPPVDTIGRDEHRLLAEIVHIEVHVPDDEAMCATCGSGYDRKNRRHRFCSKRCYNQHTAMRRQAQAAGLSAPAYGPNHHDRSSGPTRTKVAPGNAPSSFEDFKRQISLSSLQLRGR